MNEHNQNDPPIVPYEVYIGGVKADPQRIIRAYGITDMGIQQALKKLLRNGRKHKSETEDKREAVTSLQRSIEMDEEDSTIEPKAVDIIQCPYCNGQGKRITTGPGPVWEKETPCPHCGGEGKLFKPI